MLSELDQARRGQAPGSAAGLAYAALQLTRENKGRRVGSDAFAGPRGQEGVARRAQSQAWVAEVDPGEPQHGGAGAPKHLGPRMLRVDRLEEGAAEPGP